MLKTPDGKVIAPVKYITVDGYDKGYADGVEAGYADGSDKGYAEGYEKGNSDGHARGYDEGYSSGGYWKECWANMKAKDGIFVVPEGMTEMPKNMFKYFKNFTSISIPDTVTKIGENAFKEHKTLLSVNLPDSITEIGEYAFHLCENVEFDKFPQNITVLNPAVFAACRKAKFNSLNNKVTTIEAYAFDGCWENNIRVIPASVKSVSNSGFGNNRNISSMAILGKPTMTSSVFSGCTNLKDIYCNFGEGDVKNAPWGATSATIHYNYFKNAEVNFSVPPGMNEIPEKMFQNNTKITEVILDSETTAIRPRAFNGCTNLEYVTFHEGLYIIEEYAFLGCPKLNITELPDTVYEIEVAALAGTNCALSKLPANLAKIEDDAFDLCKGNTFKEIPAGVFTIGARAFKENTGLTELTIHKHPDLHIHSTAFVECDNLLDIYVDWAEGEIANAPWGAPNATIHYNHKEE